MQYFVFLAIGLVWGASFILMKKAALVFGPITIGAARVASGALVLALLWRFRDRGASISRRHWPGLVLVALVGYAWPYSIQPYLVARHGSALVGMIVSLVPLLTLAVAPVMLGVFPRRRQVAGVVGGLACLLLLLGDGLRRSVPPGHLLLAVSVPLCYAVTHTYLRRTFSGVSSLALTCVVLGLSGAVLIPPALAEPVRADGGLGLALGSLALLGVVGTGLATYLFNKLIQDHGPLFAGMVTYLIPAGAVVWGWIDGERVTLLQGTALAGLFAMVALVQYRAAETTDPAGHAADAR